MIDQDLEKRFHRAMLGVYQSAKADCGYNATYFLRMVNERGGLQAAKDLLMSSNQAAGLTELCMAGRLDLSVEALILKQEWNELFTDEERAIARQRLTDLGWKPGTPIV